MTTTDTSPMLHLADRFLAAGRWYRELGPAADDTGAPIRIVVPLANGRAVVITSRDNEAHLHVAPADRSGYPDRWGLDVHIPDYDLVAAAIKAMIAYTKTLPEV